MVSLENEKYILVNFEPGLVVTRFQPDTDSKTFFHEIFEKFLLNFPSFRGKSKSKPHFK